MSGSSSNLAPGAFLADCQRYVETEAILLGFWTAPHAHRIDLHHHREAHFMLVTSGVYSTHALQDETRPHELLIFNPAETEHDDHLETGGAFFTVTIRTASYLDQRSSLPTRPTALGGSLTLARSRLLLRELSNWQSDSGLVAHSLVAELLIAMRAAPSKRFCPSWLPRAREFIDESYFGPIDLQTIASEVGVHPFHLIRYFRRQFGTTPGEYLRARRLRAAASLLTQSTMPIAELALETGFADQSHLTHRFTRAFGLSPAAYRRRTRL